MRTTDGVTPEIERIRRELEHLNRIRIKVGIQGGGTDYRGQSVQAEADLFTIARVHEYGAVITAKTTKNLAIPIHRESYDKSPRDFPGLFFIRSEAGYLFGVVEKGRRRKGSEGDNLKFLFLLLPSVTIPERSFIRAGYDSNKNRLSEVVKDQVSEIIFNRKTATEAAEYIGGKAVDFIREFINDASNFKPKGSIQKERHPSWANSPLIVTGRLRNSITWKIEEG